MDHHFLCLPFTELDICYKEFLKNTIDKQNPLNPKSRNSYGRFGDFNTILTYANPNDTNWRTWVEIAVLLDACISVWTDHGRAQTLNLCKEMHYNIEQQLPSQKSCIISKRGYLNKTNLAFPISTPPPQNPKKIAARDISTATEPPISINAQHKSRYNKDRQRISKS